MSSERNPSQQGSHAGNPVVIENEDGNRQPGQHPQGVGATGSAVQALPVTSTSQPNDEARMASLGRMLTQHNATYPEPPPTQPTPRIGRFGQAFGTTANNASASSPASSSIASQIGRYRSPQGMATDAAFPSVIRPSTQPNHNGPNEIRESLLLRLAAMDQNRPPRAAPGPLILRSGDVIRPTTLPGVQEQQSQSDNSGPGPRVLSLRSGDEIRPTTLPPAPPRSRRGINQYSVSRPGPVTPQSSTASSATATQAPNSGAAAEEADQECDSEE